MSEAEKKAILVVYLSRKLSYTGDESTVVYHLFTLLAYLAPIFGAIISDSWWGKFKTIIYISLIYLWGLVMISVGAIPTTDFEPRTFTIIGLTLIALGVGGIKPCISALGGDQFKLPEQRQILSTYFSTLYFMTNVGSLVATVVTPIIREDVHCFGELECYSYAFGLQTVLMVFGTIAIVAGYPMYKINYPTGNMLIMVTKTICNAITTRWKEKKTNPRNHWLDYADKKYDQELIHGCKVLTRIIVLYIPVPFFWALFDQQGSRWILQASRMDGDFGTWNIKPDQLLVLNPIMILFFIPIFNQWVYPAMAVIRIHTPLRKMVTGGIFTAISFIIAAALEFQLEKHDPVLLKPLSAQLRIFNGEKCSYTMETNLPDHPMINIPGYGYYEDTNVPVPEGKLNIEYSFTPATTDCTTFASGSYVFNDNQAYTLFMSSKNTAHPLIWYTDSIAKPARSRPLARTLNNVQTDRQIKWIGVDGNIAHSEAAYEKSLTEFLPGVYTIQIDNYETMQIKLKMGGVYTILISEDSAASYTMRVTEIVTANMINMMWVIPQYIFMTMGEIMFSITGQEFSYAQAPISLKSVISACWLLTISVGNLIVVIVAEVSYFDVQSSEFFLFGALMFFDMAVFMYLAYLYKSNVVNQ